MAKFLGLLLVVVVAAVAAFYFLVLRPQQGALAAAEQSATVCGQQLASLRTQLADLTIAIGLMNVYNRMAISFRSPPAAARQYHRSGQQP